ncbi:MAG: hypothetical protein IJP66_09805, partial [Kiritimatiellae bacterium]|nr:hypothetical protein [Kiritimatiellia bacterium]
MAKLQLTNVESSANDNRPQITIVHKSSSDTNTSANGGASHRGESETFQPFNFSTGVSPTFQLALRAWL